MAKVIPKQQFLICGVRYTSSLMVLAKEYRQRLDWSILGNLTDIQQIATAAASFLESEKFTSSTAYDALNRPIKVTTPDKSEVQPTYNKANLLEKVTVNLRGATTATTFVENINYDAKGQRELIEYGNGVKTTYSYDDKTFRLTRLLTTRTSDAAKLQDLNYTFDPVGNITEIRDDSEQDVYFDNAVVSPSCKYEYDALYRLIQAEGREHAGKNTVSAEYDPHDNDRRNLPHPNDGKAMRRYTQRYQYDSVGNILAMLHKGNDGISMPKVITAYSVPVCQEMQRLQLTRIRRNIPRGMSMMFTEI